MPAALSPATLEGWYVLHQIYSVEWGRVRALEVGEPDALAREAVALFAPLPHAPEAGWSAAFRLVGGGGDLLFVHFRETLDELGRAELAVRRSRLAEYLRLEYDYLSVTEAGLYHATTQAAAEHGPGTEAFRAAVEESAAQEGASAHVRSRLYPQIPEGMRYLSFYPMTKRRSGEDNWYVLPIEERNRLMREHGLTGRKFSGRVFQVVTGSVGLDDWEWGVTLFARDPLEFKKIVTEMRYDEASARYGEFGRFFTGIRLEDAEWPTLLRTE